jgi:hypothetical protein
MPAPEPAKPAAGTATPAKPVETAPLPPAPEPAPVVVPAKPPVEAGPPQPPNNLEPIDPKEASGVMGKKVQGSKGEPMGLIVDVVVDAVGAPRAAIIDFGGFLGVGSRKIAIDWRLLQFKPGADEPVLLTLDRAHVQAAPEYKPTGPGVQMVGPSPIAPARPDAVKK